MRVVVQRVSQAGVSAGGKLLGSIDKGLVLLVAFRDSDAEPELRWMADKVWGLRVFPDENRKMNLSAGDVGGALLIVSQFTLYGDVSRGKRPSFVEAARPEKAVTLYERFVQVCREGPGRVETGEFGAMMDVELVNDGPVTILIDR
jgi:D-tyrosyl-tRNA(Tyr) deacylase